MLSDTGAKILRNLVKGKDANLGLFGSPAFAEFPLVMKNLIASGYVNKHWIVTSEGREALVKYKTKDTED